MKNLIICFLALVFFSCSSRKPKMLDVDTLIKELDALDISMFQDVRIGIREGTTTGYLYIINNANGNDPVYFVRYNTLTKNVASINREMLQRSNVPNYFSDEKIRKVARKFSELSVCGLAVDSQQNLQAQTCLGDNPPLLLRVNSFTGADTVRYNRHPYEHYKDNWYIYR